MDDKLFYAMLAMHKAQLAVAGEYTMSEEFARELFKRFDALHEDREMCDPGEGHEAIRTLGMIRDMLAPAWLVGAQQAQQTVMGTTDSNGAVGVPPRTVGKAPEMAMGYGEKPAPAMMKVEEIVNTYDDCGRVVSTATYHCL